MEAAWHYCNAIGVKPKKRRHGRTPAEQEPSEKRKNNVSKNTDYPIRAQRAGERSEEEKQMQANKNNNVTRGEYLWGICDGAQKQNRI